MPFARSVASALFDAGGERVALREDHAEVLAAGRRRELAEDLRVRHLRGRDVERGRQVDDEAVDLLVLQRLHRAGVLRGRPPAAVDGLIVVGDERVARRAELRAELERPQARRSMCTSRSSCP